MENIPQFGTKPQSSHTDRPSVYGVVFNDEKKILALKVGATYHLVGGGIDPNEEPEAALHREAKEEAGCEISDLKFIGKASQFFEKTKSGPLNKVASFYTAHVVRYDPTLSTEDDHQVYWMWPQEFLDAAAGEFQKWAVKKVVLQS